MPRDPRLTTREKARLSLAAFRAEFSDNEEPRVDRYVAWFRISPQLAQILLDRFNKRNRRVNKRRVIMYASDMRDGRWVENGEAIIITEDGILATGQHTLLAIIEAGVSVVRLLVVGVPRESIYYVDISRAKQLKDFLDLDAVHDSCGLQSACNYKVAYDEKCFLNPAARATFTTPYKREEVLPNHPGLAKCLAEVPNPNPGFGGRALWAWLFYEFQEKDVGAARDFIWAALEGTNVSKSSPVHTLRRYLEKSVARRNRGGRLSGVFIAAIAIKAWNATRRGDRGKLAMWKSGEPFPEIR